MGHNAIWVILLAILMSIVTRMIFGSLEKNIAKNDEYDAYIEKDFDKKKILKEGPEAYKFKESDLIRNVQLNYNGLKQAVVSKQYVLILVLNSFIFSRIAISTENPLSIISVIIVIESLLLLSLIDAAYGLIPDTIHVVIILASVLVMVFSDSAQLSSRLIGMAVGGILFWILHLLGGMGGGDVKLMFVAGFWLGYPMIIIAMFIGVFLAAAIGLVLIASGRKTRKDTMVFGPYLAGGIIVVTLFCEEIINLIN